MPALWIRDDIAAQELRRLTKAEKDPRAARRLLAISGALDGLSRETVARIWQFLRDRYLSGRLFIGTSAIIDGCCDAWHRARPHPIADRFRVGQTGQFLAGLALTAIVAGIYGLSVERWLASCWVQSALMAARRQVPALHRRPTETVGDKSAAWHRVNLLFVNSSMEKCGDEIINIAVRSIRQWKEFCKL